jgi:hypothetical protein
MNENEKIIEALCEGVVRDDDIKVRASEVRTGTSDDYDPNEHTFSQPSIEIDDIEPLLIRPDTFPGAFICPASVNVDLDHDFDEEAARRYYDTDNDGSLLFASFQTDDRMASLLDYSGEGIDHHFRKFNPRQSQATASMTTKELSPFQHDTGASLSSLHQKLQCDSETFHFNDEHHHETVNSTVTSSKTPRRRISNTSSSAETEQQYFQYYYDDEEYEDNINIWASRVWTSSSNGTEENYETYLEAIELAQIQIQRNHQTMSQQPSVTMNVIDENVHSMIIADPLKPPPSPLRTAVAARNPLHLFRSSVQPFCTYSSRAKSILSEKFRVNDVSWQDQLFLLPHEALRKSLHRMRRLVSLKYIPFAQKWKIDHLVRWFAFFTKFVRVQLDIKQSVIVPILECLQPAVAHSLKETLATYEATNLVLDAVRYFEVQALEQNSERVWAGFLLQLAEYFSILDNLLSVNLQRDEIEFGHALASTFTRESYLRNVQKKIEKALHGKMKRIMVPWMLNVRTVLGNEVEGWQWSSWSRFLYRYHWRPYYLINVERLLVEIEFSSD